MGTGHGQPSCGRHTKLGSKLASVCVKIPTAPAFHASIWGDERRSKPKEHIGTSASRFCGNVDDFLAAKIAIP